MMSPSPSHTERDTNFVIVNLSELRRVSIVTGLRVEQLSKRDSIPGRGKKLPFHQNVGPGSGAHPSSHIIGTICYSPGNKAVGA